MRWTNVWFVAALAIGLCATRARAGDVAASPQDVAALADGNNAFALDLYAQLAKTNSGNLFFSPYNIRTALAMAYAGARGETAEQMRKVLHFSLPDDRLHAAFAALATDLNNGATVDGQPAYELSIANGLWGQSGYRYSPGFQRLLREYYGADLQQADFIAAAEEGRQNINQWVEEQTHKNISNLIGPGILDTHTRFVLASAIYFKGNWAAQFEKGQTQMQPFHLDSKNSITMPLMYKKTANTYMGNDIIQAVGLPYVGNELEMVIFLPRDFDGLLLLEQKLAAGDMDSWLGQLQEVPVEIYLPKFRSRSQTDLPQMLATLGMADAFDTHRSDFSGITALPLYVGDAVHAAYVDVSEEGTEAAAATAILGRKKVGAVGRKQAPIIFRADHPFFFVIREESSGAVLFMGRVTDPRG
jgi:serpin B